MYILYIQTTNPLYSAAAEAYNIRSYADRDAGFDLFCEADEVPADARGQKLGVDCRAAFYDTELKIFRAFWLLPRSSISKTGMRLANSVGLIDAGYRGFILAAVDNHSADLTIKTGDRYFQLAAPDLLPWHKVQVVDTIPGGETLRGEGGFGSTGAGASGAPDAAADGKINYFI